jgi:hypothetical protein
MPNDSDYLALGIRPDDIDMDNGDLRKKASVVQSVKDVSGGKLGSEQLTKTLRSLTDSISQRVEATTVGAVKLIIPDIEAEIFKIEELLKSNKEADDQKAMDIIKNLQEKAGISLRNFSKELNNSITKLEKIVQQKKQKEQQEKDDKKDKIYQLEERQKQLKQEGLNVVVDKDNLKLKVRTNKEIFIEQQSIIKKEKDIEKLRERLLKEEKLLQKGETITQEQSDKIINKHKILKSQEEKLQLRKEQMGMNGTSQSGQSGGPISDMFSGMKSTMMQGLNAPKELFNYFKLMGKEILGFIPGMSSIGKGFKTIGKSLGDFTKSIGKSTMALLRMAMASLISSAKYILIGIAIAGAVAGIMKAFSWLKGKSAALTPEERAKSEQITDTGDFAPTTDPMTTKLNDGGMGKAEYTDYKDPPPKILPMNREAGNREYTDYEQEQSFLGKINAGDKAPINLNKMSTDFAANKEKSSNNNVVVAPTNNVSNQNQNSSVSFPMEVDNYDRSFRNIGTSLAV